MVKGNYLSSACFQKNDNNTDKHRLKTYKASFQSVFICKSKISEAKSVAERIKV